MSRLLCVACVLCGTSAVASAEVSEDVRRVSDDVRRLPERRAVHLPETTASHTWIEIRQDSILAAGAAPDFADVRIVTEAGEVIPFLVTEPESLSEFTWSLVDSFAIAWEREGQNRFQPASRLQHKCLLPIAADLERHLLVLPGRVTDYVPRVRSRSRHRTWFSSDADLHVVRFTPQEGDGHVAMETQARELWLTTAPGVEPPQGHARLYRPVRRCPPIVAIPAPVPATSFEGREWQAEFRLTGSPRFLVGLTVASSKGAWLRPYEVHLDTSRGWKATFVHADSPCGPSPADERVTWQPLSAGGVRVRVEGADPPNAPFRAESLLVIPTRARAWVPTAGRLWVAYGDEELERPLWRLPERMTILATPVAALGPPERNPFYDADTLKLLWLKRHPGVLTGVMFALLGLIALVLFKWRPKPTPE